MKKLISLFVTFCMFFSLCIPASAKDSGTSNQITLPSVNAETYSAMMNIPIYVTTMKENKTLSQIQKDNIAATIQKKNTLSSKYTRAESGTIVQQTSQYSVKQLSNTEKQAAIKSPILAPTFERYKEIIDNGGTINYINLYLPEGLSLTYSGQEDDESYWESNCAWYCDDNRSKSTYNGYKFLTLESASNVETNEVTPGNLSGSMNWTEIVNMAVRGALDVYVQDDFYQAVTTVSDVISTFLNNYEPPLSVTYSPASEYYKSSVSGTLYVKQIIIQDKLDKVSGYAYYPWGHTESLSCYINVRVKYPTDQRPTGAYNYVVTSGSYPTPEIETPGYEGNSTLYRSVIDLYKNHIGTFYHNEYIDDRSYIAELLG